MGARRGRSATRRLPLQADAVATPSSISNHIVNYVTPGYATAVFVSAQGVERIRTTAESHRRIAIIEVMGRHSGYIALGTAYGQPDIILVPEHPLDTRPARRAGQASLRPAEERRHRLRRGHRRRDRAASSAPRSKSTDPAGNVALSGAAEALRAKLIADGSATITSRRYRRGESAREAIFTRKVGPHAARRPADPLRPFLRRAARRQGRRPALEGRNNAVSILQYNSTKGFHVEGYDANRFRDRWGLIHARQMHPALYDPNLMKPSRIGIDYLLPIFTDAIGRTMPSTCARRCSPPATWRSRITRSTPT